MSEKNVSCTSPEVSMNWMKCPSTFASIAQFIFKTNFVETTSRDWMIIGYNRCSQKQQLSIQLILIYFHKNCVFSPFHDVAKIFTPPFTYKIPANLFPFQLQKIWTISACKCPKYRFVKFWHFHCNEIKQKKTYVRFHFCLGKLLMFSFDSQAFYLAVKGDHDHEMQYK